ATVNRGIARCDTDVVVLNSDTEVGPRWLTQLALACYAADGIGTVTAVSDKAGAFSVPIPNGDASHDLSRDDVARWVARTSHRIRPWTPTANGFCMYLRRAMLDDVGLLDATAFPRGYGEENDLCMRAAANGWRHVVDDATLVYHVESASFGHDERERLTAAGLQVVGRRWPEYPGLARRFVGSDELAAVRRVVGDACDRMPTRVPTRVLAVLHDGEGGTPAACQDIMDATAPSHEGLVLKSDGRLLSLHRHYVNAPPLERHVLAHPVGFGAERHAEYEHVVGDWMVRYGIELVHVHHLIKHPLSLVNVAASLHLPVVFSVHDFYLVCPTVHLLDEQDRHCGGVCTPGPGPCNVDWADPVAVPQLKHDWVHVWRSRVRAVLPLVDVFVTMNDTTWDVVTTAYPELAGRAMELIEHGRDLDQRSMAGEPPGPGERLRVLVPGSTGVHKGARLIAEVAARDVGRRVEFHFLGKIDPRFAHAGVSHGRYRREEFADRVAAIAPHVIGLFSIWPETYAYTLSEAWSTGIPVVASNLGALGDRVAKHGGGWVVDVSDAERLLSALMAIADDPDGYREAAASVSLAGVRSLSAMGADYVRLYDSLSDAHVSPTEGEFVAMGESQ
ncbi:MAG: hypothetical protein R3320_13130, partial [Nitriliruptorales bacterium]|nr:hypothetical protein [Nitriliruptorales bacterium]